MKLKQEKIDKLTEFNIKEIKYYNKYLRELEIERHLIANELSMKKIAENEEEVIFNYDNNEYERLIKVLEVNDFKSEMKIISRAYETLFGRQKCK